MRNYLLSILIVIILCQSGLSQSEQRTGWGWGGVPALNYNADDGFGYGVLLNLFNYAEGGYSPYYYKINPIIFFTTGGKQDHTLFFDSPYILGKGYRINIRLRLKKEKFYPYYGLGNDSQYHSNWIDEDNEYRGTHYYNMRTVQTKLITNLQKALLYRENDKPLISVLAGLGIANVSNEYTPNDDKMTKLEEDVNADRVSAEEVDGGLNNYLKAGLIYDTRDNEPAPNSGAWSSFLLEWYTKLLGSDYQFTRLTLTDRRYVTLFKNLVYANRVIFEHLLGEAPFFMYYPYGSSMKADEGLGGYRSIRGVYKNRYIGETKFFVNMELRYKFYEFSFANQDFYLAANIFYDFGRVWDEHDQAGGLANLHDGKGAGLHIAWNENFIVYAEMGFSKEAGSQLYIDIGYLF